MSMNQILSSPKWFQNYLPVISRRLGANVAIVVSLTLSVLSVSTSRLEI